MNRRTFFQQSSLATLGSMTLPRWARDAFTTQPFTNRRSLLPYLVVEDIIRLVQTTSWDEDFIQGLDINKTMIHLGGMARMKSDFLAEQAGQIASKWQQKATLDEAQTSLALLCGISLFSIIDREKPFDQYVTNHSSGMSTLSEAAMMHDIRLIKEIFNADPTRKMIPLDQKLDKIAADEITSLIGVIRQRNLIRMHTFRPEFADAETWMAKLLTYHTIIEEEDQRYGSMYCQPTKISNRSSTKFYDAMDPVILLARSLQMGITEIDVDIESARARKASSQYGHILQGCLNKLEQWQGLIHGETSVANALGD